MRLRRRDPATSRQPLHVLLYGRPGCHLCDQAEDVLGSLARSFDLAVTKVDIEDDDDLVREYAIRIPVVVDAATGVVLAEGVVERHALRASLRSFSRSR